MKLFKTPVTDMSLFTIYKKRKFMLSNLGVPLLDVSNSTGHEVFKPHSSDMFLYLQGHFQSNEHEFIDRFRNKLMTHFRNNPTFWYQLARAPVLGVYCDRPVCDDLSNRRHVRDVLFMARKEMGLDLKICGMEITTKSLAERLIY